MTSDLTLTSFEEDEDLDETLSDASSVDYTIAYHSGTLASEAEELSREHHRQQNSRQGSQKHSIVPTTSNRFHPLKHSTTQKSSNHVRNMDQQSVAVLHRTDSDIDTLNANEASASSLDLSNASALDWNLHVIISMAGCAEHCVKKIHQLNEHAVLSAHSQF